MSIWNDMGMVLHFLVRQWQYSWQVQDLRSELVLQDRQRPEL